MPRFHFHVDDGTFMPDLEGTDLADVNAARSEAVKAAGEMLVELDGHLWEGDKSWMMHVTDEADMLLFSLSFSGKVTMGKVRFRPEE